MVCKTPVKLCLLGLGQRWCSTTTDDPVPNGLNQLDLLVYVEFSCLP